MDSIKDILDKEVEYRNSTTEISFDKPDPLLIAKRYKDEYISLICALFAYGKASLIVKFLDNLDFELLQKDEESIKKELDTYYRFQTPQDVREFFIAIKRLKEIDSIENIVKEGYKKENNILDGLYNIIDTIQNINPYNSKGYQFLVGNRPNPKKLSSQSPYKRWNMYFRWMIREDNLDFGLWKSIDKKDLILPLDTHTHKVSINLGLIDRKTYDLKSAIMITEKLKKFDSQDPIKYDFALYRIGQEKII
jgi:uncharacterized protein (TIGR02757 family)